MHTKANSIGSMQSFQIAPGLNLRIADFVPSETVEQRFEIATPAMRFHFHIFGAGYWELRSPRLPRTQRRVNQADRISSLFFYPQMEGRLHLPVECRQFHLGISILPSRLNNYLGKNLSCLPEALRDISAGRTDRSYSHAGPLSRMMHQVVRDLLDCPYAGTMKALYLEAKAMELIILKMGQTIGDNEGEDKLCDLDRQEVDRLWYAREILSRDLENPPTLFDLARAVGTNHCRLNAGFRKLYGATVFDYLRQKRLIEARRLIQEEGMNVTEAALTVGYNSISSFSKAFSEHFGLSPVNFRKRYK